MYTLDETKGVKATLAAHIHEYLEVTLTPTQVDDMCDNFDLILYEYVDDSASTLSAALSIPYALKHSDSYEHLFICDTLAEIVMAWVMNDVPKHAPNLHWFEEVCKAKALDLLPVFTTYI